MAGKQAKTIVEYFAEHESYRCGYCGQPDTNYSHGMWAHALSVQDYEDLLDRGWRRSGKYCYKPTMNMTCCPQYTIKCKVGDFKLRKSHKKVLKRVNKFLIDGIKPAAGTDENDDNLDEGQSKNKMTTQSPDDQSDEAGAPSTSQNDTNMLASDKGKAKQFRSGDGADPDKPPCKKAKDLRKERKQAKLSSKVDKSAHKPASHKQNCEDKTLEEILSEPEKVEKCAHKLEIRLVRSCPQSKEFQDSLKESHAVYHRYQMSIHHDTADKPSLKQFTRFLVDSPLEEEKGDLPQGYGSFHMQYILDGKIICVGVLDVLPSLVSSKYLYYDPDYSFLSLGTYSALRELAFVRDLHNYSEQLIYYYMGFYIHSCPKMKYKGQYFPSFLLCPETYTWHPVEKCSPLLDQKKYARFADQSEEDVGGKINLEQVCVLYMRQAMPYKLYKVLSHGANKDEQEVTQYAGFVGKTCAERMYLFRK